MKVSIDNILTQSRAAWYVYRKSSLHQRAALLRAIAAQLVHKRSELLLAAQQETHLTESRLQTEWARMLFQFTSYAEACETGLWMDLRIDTVTAASNSSKKDIRKTKVPIGPVVVFGASNFPFAYATAGGDTACALAAGCSVVVKAHPAHPNTHQLLARAIEEAVLQSGLPNGLFLSVQTDASNKDYDVEQQLVQHPYTAAVAFTGSFTAGQQLLKWSSERQVPIPVFAEMGSVNPVFILPQQIDKEPDWIAAQLADSITQSAGQFCTNPGLMIAIEGDGLHRFVESITRMINQTPAFEMLHPGIANAYKQLKNEALLQDGVSLLASSSDTSPLAGVPTIATVAAPDFIRNPVLHKEVFGPYSLLIRCQNESELIAVAEQLEGQLTATVFGTNDDVVVFDRLMDRLREIAGRLIFNGVPTGVEVCFSMHHGGPFPATTDSRFTAVGADGILRFVRPVCYQNWPDAWLPPELQNSNPLAIWRTINNQPGRDAVQTS